jgi:hypothetical protein
MRHSRTVSEASSDGFSLHFEGPQSRRSPTSGDGRMDDTFIVNAKFIELLQSIAGSETLVPIQTLLEQLPSESDGQQNNVKPKLVKNGQAEIIEAKSSKRTHCQWDKVCFYVTPIGEEASEQSLQSRDSNSGARRIRGSDRQQPDIGIFSRHYGRYSSRWWSGPARVIK